MRAYIHTLLDPTSAVSQSQAGGGAGGCGLFDLKMSEEDYYALLERDPDTLFQDETYMKHLRRHANKYVRTYVCVYVCVCVCVVCMVCVF